MRFRFPIFEFPPEAEALRAEVRAFIAEELAAKRWQRGGDFASHYDAGFSQRLGARGWLGMTWPKRYGGHHWVNRSSRFNILRIIYSVLVP